MSFDTLEPHRRAGKETLGILPHLLSGGEPLVRKDDVIRLCETHGDCVFMVSTNGTFIDEGLRRRDVWAQNWVPAISAGGL